MLRTTLRQDPDIILVGEMRDQETVEIGLRAAITGHLVFSTLHTMNAVATVTRLLDMGAAGYMIAAALHGIVAQRLVRRVCENCAQPAEPDAASARLADRPGRRSARPPRCSFKAGAGCTYCNLSGYRGRVAIYEILELDRALADAIRRNDSSGFSQAARLRRGYVPLTAGGIAARRSKASRASPKRSASPAGCDDAQEAEYVEPLAG